MCPPLDSDVDPHAGLLNAMISGHPTWLYNPEMSALFYPPRDGGQIITSDSASSQRCNGDCLRSPLDVSVQGLPTFEQTGVTGGFPMHQRSGPRSSDWINCVKVVSVWENAHHPIGLEITQWTRIFKDSLAAQICTSLDGLLSRFCKQWMGYSFQTAPNLAVVLHELGYCKIDINVDNLIGNMLSNFFKQYDADTAAARLPWTYSQANLAQFIYTFIHAMDCFTTGSGTPSVITGFALEDRHGATTQIKANVKTHSVHFKFVDLPVSLPAGAEYIVKPQFTPATIWHKTASWTKPRHSIVYDIEQSPFPLTWDDVDECFRTQLPSELVKDGAQDVNIVINARLKINFPQDVVYVETATFALNLHVFDSQDESERADSIIDSPALPNLSAHSGTSEDFSMRESHSSGKRKAFEALDKTGSPSKRPAPLKLVNDSGITRPTVSDLAAEAVSVLADARRAADGRSSWEFDRKSTHPKNVRDPREIMSRFFDNAPPGLLHHASQSSSSASPSPPSNRSVCQPSAASTTSGLSQAKIQANYAEFERKKLRREMRLQDRCAKISNLDGMVSPDDEIDVERKEFEDFLLDNSDADFDFDDDN